MQRLSLLLLLLYPLSLLILEVAVANPVPFAEPGGWGDWKGHNCISEAQAADFVSKMHSLSHCMDATLAEQSLTPNFKSYSWTLIRTSV